MNKFVLSVIFILAGCTKIELSRSIPSCISDEIGKFKLNDSCDRSKVDEYLFQNKKVYVFDDQLCCCDHTAVVLNKDCQSLGFLGGFVGNNEINGEDFTKAILIRNLWKE